MHKDIKKYIRSCNICCVSKVPHHKPYGLLKPLPIGNNSWESISIDFITDLPPSNGMSCILVVFDCFTKMVHLFLLNQFLLLRLVLNNFLTPFSYFMVYQRILCRIEVLSLLPNFGIDYLIYFMLIFAYPMLIISKLMVKRRG